MWNETYTLIHWSGQASALFDPLLFLSPHFARCLLIVLMMEAVSPSEASVNFYQTTRRNNPEDNDYFLKQFLPIDLCNGDVLCFL
jgi:hypothetical protein